MTEIKLSKRQTKTLTNVLKKVDVEVIGFEQAENGSIIFKAGNVYGWHIVFEVDPSGRAVALKKETDPDESNTVQPENLPQ